MEVGSWEWHYRVLQLYLGGCVLRKDWHGVSDAANDLRVFEALHPEVLNET